MSGGGADGAFAAGMLNGWSQSGKRPEFTVVTGVSIGALIAPYAFLGHKLDGGLRAASPRSPAPTFRGPADARKLLDTWPLRRLIEKRVTPELVAEVAAEHKKGRRLFIVTTNVDAGRRVVWDMGAIARRATKPRSSCSATCSGVVGDSRLLHAGADRCRGQRQEVPGDAYRRLVTSPFFVAPEALLEPGSKLKLPATELYIILNGRLSPDFYPPERNTVQILSRLISVVLRRACARAMLFGATRSVSAFRCMSRRSPTTSISVLRPVRREIHERAL